MATMSATPSPTRRARKAAAPLLAGLMLLGACSKKDETTTSATTASTAASSGGGSTTTAKAADKTTTTEGGTTKGTTTKGSTPGTTAKSTSSGDEPNVWFRGFKITLGEPKVNDEEKTLSFESTIENLGTDKATIYGDFSLEADGAVYGTGNWKENPEVLPKSKSKDTLVFNLDEKFDQNATTLVMGNGNEDQVRIPLGGSGDVITLEPQEQEYKKDLKLGQITYTISKSEVRYDRIDNHGQAEKDTAYLVLWGEAKNTSATETLYIDPGKFEIALPDDTKSVAEHYQGETSFTPTQKDDKVAIYFVIKKPYPGDYTITLTSNTGPEAAEATATEKIAVKITS